MGQKQETKRSSIWQEPRDTYQWGNEVWPSVMFCQSSNLHRQWVAVEVNFYESKFSGQQKDRLEKPAIVITCVYHNSQARK